MRSLGPTPVRVRVVIVLAAAVGCGGTSHVPAISSATVVPAHVVEKHDERSRRDETAKGITPLVEEDVGTPWAVAEPEAVGLKRAPLAKLVAEAERTGSDTLLVLCGDRLVVSRSFGHASEPLELMSVTKGFVGLAIGFLLEEGKLSSLDEPMSTWFPEWKDGSKDPRKPRVTLRHVLTHTSGLAHKPAAGELAKQRDRVAYVRALPIETEPGEVFSYNNEAVQLLSVVVAAAAKEPIDAYLKRKLFDPLSIDRFSWDRDAVGNRATAWGLALSAVDLAKVGVTLRDDGMYRGARIVPAKWIARMQEPTRAASFHGLLTWLLHEGTLQVQTRERRENLASEGFVAGNVVGWNFNGWLGQYLVVYPGAGAVAVRQHREPKNVTDEDNARIGMKDFTDLVRAALP
jgi:CubicO group peptidase (beta-lactamase class C family)